MTRMFKFSKIQLAVATAILVTAVAACGQPSVGAEVPPTLVASSPTIAPAAIATTVPPETPTAALPGTLAGSTETPSDTPALPPTITPTSKPGPGAIATATPVPAPITTIPVPATEVPPTSTPAPQPTSTSTPIPSPPTPTPIVPLARTTQFIPLDNPVFVSAANAPARVQPESFVLGFDWNGEARAYPLDMMWWHHIVNDTIGGDPVLVTY